MVKNIPKWSRTFISEEGARRIEAAVRAAEQRTSGEIVPVLVRRSASTGLVPLVMGLLFMLLTVGLQLSLTPSDAKEAAWIWMLVILLAAALGWGLGKVPRIQRWILPRFEQEDAAKKRALLEFYLAGLNKTAGGTGVLLFVSLDEHQAVVLADQGIAQYCQPEVFEEVMRDLVQGAKQNDLAAGFERAIQRSCDILAPYFPRLKHDDNELSDHLIIREE